MKPRQNELIQALKAAGVEEHQIQKILAKAKNGNGGRMTRAGLRKALSTLPDEQQSKIFAAATGESTHDESTTGASEGGEQHRATAELQPA